MPDFSPIIADAYREILGREPVPTGLDFYNGRMNAGLSEAALREILVRSDEYLRKNDGFRPLVIDGAFNFEWRGYTRFGPFRRSLDEPRQSAPRPRPQASSGRRARAPSLLRSP